MSTDPLTYVLSCLRRAADNAYPWSVTPGEAGALVSEVERLRELLLNAGWPREADGIAELALQAERAAVVAWLRGEPERLVECNGHRHADGKPCWVMSPMPAEELADCIERGEHRRKEEP
jgi:hypothetical protein